MCVHGVVFLSSSLDTLCHGMCVCALLGLGLITVHGRNVIHGRRNFAALIPNVLRVFFLFPKKKSSNKSEHRAKASMTTSIMYAYKKKVAVRIWDR